MIYRLSHFLGDGEMYHQHFIDTNDEHGQGWLDHFISGAGSHSHPEYVLKVEEFELTNSFVVRPQNRRSVVSSHYKPDYEIDEIRKGKMR